MFLAEKPKRELASRCRLVRSNSAGDSWVDGLDSSETVPGLSRQAATMLLASASLHSRDSRASGSNSFFLNFGSNQRPSYSPAAAMNSARTSQ